MSAEWFIFFAAVAFCSAILFIPGFCCLKGCGFQRQTSLVVAPACSVVVYSLLGVCLSELGIPSTGWIVLGLSFVLCSVPLLVKKTFSRKQEAHCFSGKWSFVSTKSAAIIALYVAVSFVAALVFYILPLDGPASYMETYDNVHHYGLVQSFLSSCNWSALDASLYLSQYDASISPFEDGGGYYPSAWHVLVAMIAGIFNTSVPFAANVVNVAFIATVYPIGMYGFVRYFFRHCKTAVYLGAVCVPAFSAFPWVLLLQWPLYPNFISMSFMPASLLLFMEAAKARASFLDRIRYIFGFCLTIVTFCFAQPNTAFAVAISLIPYCVWRCADVADVFPGRLRGKKPLRFACSLFFLVIAICIWIALYKAPFLQGVVNFQWDAVCSLSDAVLSALNLSQNTFIPQYLLAILVLVGALAGLCRPEYRWLSFSYVMFAVIFSVSYGTEGVLKHFLAGFWYTDYYRIAAVMAILGVPLAAYGLAIVLKGLVFLWKKLGMFEKHALSIASLVLGLVFSIAILMPIEGNVFSWLRVFAVNISSSGMIAPFDKDEQDFMDEVKTLIGEDELLVNMPYDGSMYSYGAEGSNLYYRSISGYGGGDETPESLAIRERLCDVATDGEVRDALASIGAEYVLDLGESEGAFEANPDYVSNDWRGIKDVEDGVAGFEVVLERGDMRLFRIVA